MEGKNTRMLFNLGTWMATTLGWAGLLWFGLKLELTSYFPRTLIAIHLVPPLLITLVVAAWRHVRKRRAASREAERLAFEQEKHVAAQLAAQQAHLAYMAQRREGCDCRGVAVTGLRVPDDQVLQCLPQGDGLYWSLLELEDEPKAQDPHAALVPHLQEALRALYQRCPAAIWLPLFICPPAAAEIGASWQDWVRDAAQSVAHTIVGDQLPAMSLRLLPEAVHITERYLDLFESDPTLPGAIVLGFDSPAMFGVLDTPCDVPDSSAQESRLWLGRPGQAVVALLLTAPWLAHRADSLRVKTSQPVVDSYTPYWDRDTVVHDEAWFAQIPAPWRDSLLDVPILARLYRGGYPAFDPHDLDARAGKFEWVNRQLASVIREIPLTSVQHGAYTWNDWQASREVKNLGLRDLQLREAAIAGGKLSDECFDKSVRESGQQHYSDLATEVANACQDLHQLEAWLDRHMGAQAPSLVDLRQALADCDAVIRQVLAQFGGGSISPHVMLPDIHPQTTSVNPVVTSVSLAGVSVHAGAIASRTAALQALRQAAQYFRINEPHSPVALLAERAARWGEMSLEEWLASVIKDDGTLHQLDELLGVRRG